MSTETKEQPADKYGLFEKINKSDEEPMEEFKTGIGFLDKTVAKVDSGVKAIHNKIHGGGDDK